MQNNRKNMTRTEIDNTEHPLFAPFEKLYAVSFPLFEQRTRMQQEAAFGSTNYRLAGFADEDSFSGFISYWEFDTYVYIEHFAIDTDKRGRGLGSEILRSFIRSAGKTVLLEIDPLTDEISRARLRFYEKCGLTRNPYPHTHPPYREGHRPHPLIVLTTGGPIPEEMYRTFEHDLHAVVMKR